MSPAAGLTIFGEVLFDCFPGGEQILGGAPFNVAWHAQALGDRPQFISRVGDDEPGRRILSAMAAWGMSTAGVQIDPEHQTGRVAVSLREDEPQYEIVPDCAYDFIDAAPISAPPAGGILYHGTLGLRSSVSRKALHRLRRTRTSAIFLDVNLRSPWWQQAEVFDWLKEAHWVKLNQAELRLLGFTAVDLRQEMARFQAEFQLEQLILTRGEEGALVRTAAGEYHQLLPIKAERVVDSVGAGDAFTAVYLHGLLSAWSLDETLEAAQKFASKIIGVRGATTDDPGFYRDLTP